MKPSAALAPIRRLVAASAGAARAADFWAAAAAALSDWAGGARVELKYRGRAARGTAKAGEGAPAGANPLALEWSDKEGRRVDATFAAVPPGASLLDVQSVLDAAADLAVQVGRRLALERDRRLGAFIVELSRWLLAAPERDLTLRYTLQSVLQLFDAQGAYAALRETEGGPLRVAVALEQAAELKDVILPLEASTTGRVVRNAEALLTANLLAEPDAVTPTGVGVDVRAAMIAPLHGSAGVHGAVGLLRYRQPGDESDPPPFAVSDLHYFLAVAAHIAGGLELAQLVAGTRAAANRARAMVGASPLPMALVDDRGHVHQVNEAARRVFGVDADSDALGKSLDALGLSPREISLKAVLSRRRGAEPWHGRVLVTQPSGDRRICDCTVTDLAGLGSEDLLVALYDRTDELRAQRELVAREKLATVGEIASGVAHEVNNPLAAIRMEAELLGRGSTDPETGAAASAIMREVDRAARIVRSLLRLARRADTQPTRVQVNELVRDVAEIRQRVLRTDNVQFQTDMDQGAAAVLGLGQELQQVVINLVTNAEHAIRGRTPAIIRLSTLAREGWVRLTVEDSGPGVPAAVRDRIFDPFFTTKGPDEGSGLGLAICQRVAAEVGGRIWLEDSELGGAKFVVELPAAPERVSGEQTIG
ncbi:MAG TPA: ATP-binding protein [Gemmatimonadales bacterium]|nr:ATP-binding protein [Gemmatimonadales bacterium]